jgi:hypothetical protein
MCYGDNCKTIDKNCPIYCPDCMAENFINITEDELYDMYCYFISTDDMDEEIKELFFVTFNQFFILKRLQSKD